MTARELELIQKIIREVSSVSQAMTDLAIAVAALATRVQALEAKATSVVPEDSAGIETQVAAINALAPDAPAAGSSS